MKMIGGDTLEKMYTVKEVSEMLGVAKLTVYNWVNTEKVRSLKIGNTIRIPESAITEMMKGD